MKETMQRMGKLLVIILSVLTVCGGCVEREPIEDEGLLQNEPNAAEQQDLRSYFPALKGMTYQYAGEGNEYASFTRTIKYVENSYIQVYDDNGGTVSVAVYEQRKDQVARLFSQAEFYQDENILGKIGAEKTEEEVILKTPLQAGNAWESGEWKREIVDADATVTVPVGTFYHVVKVQLTSKKPENTSKSFEYYAENIGLVMREYTGDGYTVTSRLASYGTARADAAEPDQSTAGRPMANTAAGDGEEWGGDAITAAAMQDADLPLLAYQLESQLRSAFRAAYESYVNLQHFSADGQKEFDQILALYRAGILHLATGELVDEQLQRLREYYAAEQTGASFPHEEIVQAAKLLDRTSTSARIGLSVQKFYPEDGDGRTVGRHGDYIVELRRTGLIWKIAAVEEAD